MIHALKLRALPLADEADHREIELIGFLDQARAEIDPSMRQRLDVQRLVRLIGMDGAPQPLSEMSPFILDDFLTGDPDALLAKLDAPTVP